MGSPESWKTPSILEFWESVGHESRDSRPTGVSGELPEHCVPQTVALPAVGHDERDLSVLLIVQSVEPGDAHDVVVDRGDDCFADRDGRRE